MCSSLVPVLVAAVPATPQSSLVKLRCGRLFREPLWLFSACLPVSFASAFWSTRHLFAAIDSSCVLGFPARPGVRSTGGLEPSGSDRSNDKRAEPSTRVVYPRRFQADSRCDRILPSPLLSVPPPTTLITLLTPGFLPLPSLHPICSFDKRT